MAELLVLFLLVVVACTWFGVKLVRRGLRRSLDPPIPQARVANPGGLDAAYAKAARAPRKIGKGVLVVGGLALIAAPWIALGAVISGLSALGGGGTGRPLRIRGRARLPERATGDGWSHGEISLESQLSTSERAVLGEQWLEAARMEHASVAAFSQLSIQLATLGAPARLLAAAHRAALEEIDHAERCFAIARAITGVAHTAGPIPALASRSSRIDHVRLAIDSLVDGCVAEGIAADVAQRDARLAGEPIIRETLRVIARDEAGHAELAWDVLAWCLDVGGERVQRAVAARVDQLDRNAHGRLAKTRIAEVQARARELLRCERAAA
jgi:hypothetical protein